jgi:hypothetical protein
MWGYRESFVECESLERLALVFGLIRHRAGTALGNGWRIQRVGCCTKD